MWLSCSILLVPSYVVAYRSFSLFWNVDLRGNFFFSFFYLKKLVWIYQYLISIYKQFLPLKRISSDIFYPMAEGVCHPNHAIHSSSFEYGRSIWDGSARSIEKTPDTQCSLLIVRKVHQLDSIWKKKNSWELRQSIDTVVLPIFIEKKWLACQRFCLTKDILI